jgi:hypothetical protein
VQGRGGTACRQKNAGGGLLTTSEIGATTMTMETGPVPTLKLNADGGTFSLGEVVSTPGVAQEVSPDEVAVALGRHVRGDWGDLDQHEWEANDYSLESGLRLRSVYCTKAGRRFWVITEADRSVTTVLLPEDY